MDSLREVIDMRRREFLSTVAAAGVGAAAAAGITSADDQPQKRLPTRPLGDTGKALSIVGLGGLVVAKVPQQEANDIVAWAWDKGVNYYDVAPTYYDAQDRLGPALEPYRDKAFLACKTVRRDSEGALAELENSLKVLRTDHFDLYQFHGVTKTEEVDQIMAPGGAMETFLKAREQGKIGLIGFSAHSIEAALLMLDRFNFDTVLFPLNVVCWENGNFGPQLVAKAKEKGAKLLAIKAMAWTPLQPGEEKKYPKAWYRPNDDPDLSGLAIRYTLDLPVVSIIPPADDRLFRIAVDKAMDYRPLTQPERDRLIASIESVKPIFSTQEA